MQVEHAVLHDAVGVHTILGSSEALSIAAVRSDSREVEHGDLFICIAGEHTDGHAFAFDAVQRGATALMAECDPFADADERPHVAVLLVDDTVKALGRLAAWHRSQSKAQVVGVTGTAGKTTVKELLAHVLSQRGTVARNPLNLNNQIGLPLSILAASGDEDYWVMEAGISQPHDMDELGAILRPNIGLVLNAGQGHTAGLGERGVAYHKARLLAHLADDGMGFVCADYDALVREARGQCHNLEFFSAAGRPLRYRAAYVGAADTTKGRYRVWLDGEAHEVVAPFRGAFGAENVAAVAAIAHQLGFSGEDITTGLATAELPKQRFACEEVNGFVVIDDTYNANPLSFMRMVDAVAEMAVGGSLTFVLGEMLELGDESEEAHERLGRALASTGAQAIFWKGGEGACIATGLQRGGFKGVFCPVEDAASFVEAFQHVGIKEGHILFKGSRGNRLELLRAAFLEEIVKSENNNAI